MRKRAYRKGARPVRVAGPSVHGVSVITLAFLAVFVAAVTTLIVSALLYTDLRTIGGLFRSREVLAAMRLTALASLITLSLVVVFSVPIGYALSRYRFPGHSIADTIIDLPIVLPPLVIGVALLVFFGTAAGRWIERLGFDPHSIKGIVLCQFLVSAPFAIRSTKSAFDAVDQRLEHLALTLGCSHFQAFARVALPLARNGVVAGAIVAWARAVGVFGPLMVFVGSVRLKTEVMPTTVYLEVTIGRLDVALAVAAIMVACAAAALIAIRRFAGGRKWWGV